MLAGLRKPSGTPSFILLLDQHLLKHHILISFTSGNIQDFVIFSHPVSQKSSLVSKPFPAHLYCFCCNFTFVHFLVITLDSFALLPWQEGA